MSITTIEEVYKVFSERLKPGGDEFLDEGEPGDAADLAEDLDPQLVTSFEEARLLCSQISQRLIENDTPVQNGFVIVNTWVSIEIGTEAGNQEIQLHVYLECGGPFEPA